MINVIGIFEDKLIKESFIKELGFASAGIIDVFLYDSHKKAISSLAKHNCDVVFTDNNFGQITEEDFFDALASSERNIKTIMLCDKLDLNRMRTYFKYGASDCLTLDEFDTEYIDELMSSLRKDGSYEADELNEERLREFFWSNTKQRNNITRSFKIDTNNAYFGLIRILNVEDASPVSLKSCLSKHFKVKTNGEFFFNSVSQIAILFSPENGFDVEDFEAEMKKTVGLLAEKFELKLFAVISSHSDSVARWRREWMKFCRYTEYYFVSPENCVSAEYIEREYTDDFDADKAYAEWKDILERLDIGAFEKKAEELIKIKPAYPNLSALITFVKFLYSEVSVIDNRYHIGDVNIDFDSVTAEQNICFTVEYLKKTFYAVAESISDSNKISIQIKKYCEKHIGENITLGDMAEKFNFEYNYFSKVFLKVMGMSFKKYLNELRIETSLNLIKNTNKKLYEIALMCGYKNYEHFSRVFHAKYGKWPRDVKRNIIG